MNLAIVTGRISRNDGQGRVNREIAEEALRRGHAVTLFAEHVDAEMAARPGVTAHVFPPPRWLPTRLFRDQVFAWRSWLRLRQERARCDVVLANGFVTWARSDLNAVHFVHGAWARSRWHPWRVRRSLRSAYALGYNWLNTLLERHALRRTGRVIAVSAKTREEVIAIGVPAASVLTICNGVDLEEFHPGPPERHRFGLPENVPMALFAGDLKTSRKNLETVLRALALVPDLHLAVAGRSDGTPYPALARSLGIAGRVHFLGFQREMSTLMRSVDLLAFPSRYEGLSLVFLEALASGLPIVTARSAGGAELLDAAVGIVIDDSEDHHAYAAALAALIEDPARRAAMSAAARARAQPHAWQSMAGDYIDLMVAAAPTQAPPRRALVAA
jgi:glycosyltransferase involved in cell wall biosynthesis